MSDESPHSQRAAGDRDPFDPGIARLERVLAPLRYEPEEFAGPRPRVRTGFVTTLAIGALGVALVLAVIAPAPERPPRHLAAVPLDDHRAFWFVEHLSGGCTLSGRPLAGDGHLPVGDWLETRQGARARVHVADIGDVVVGPDTRIRLVATGEDSHRMELAHGRIDARVLAPPRLFCVQTPSATAVDLGCAYTLTVESDRGGRLEVTSGSVALEWGDREAIVPAGAICKTRDGVGPGTPYFLDAPRELREALHRLDFRGEIQALPRTLTHCSGPRGALPLWHLLQRVPREFRGQVYERLELVSGRPADVTRAATLALESEALGAWWERISAQWD